MRRALVWFAAAAASLGAATARAADHLDGPAASADPAADITDLYAWTSTDGSQLYLVMDVFPSASTISKFSNSVQYVFHTSSRGRFGDPAAATQNIICTFDVNQRISCWAGGEYLTGDASGLSGIASSSGKLRVFAGPRDDPFFFNLDGFKAAVSAVKSKKSSLTFDAAGCPAVDAATSAALVGLLGSDGKGGPAVDHFARMNVLSIVVAVDKSIVTQSGPIVGVWASTHRAP